MRLYDRLYIWQYWLRLKYVGNLYKWRIRHRTPAPVPIPPPKRVLLVVAGMIGDSVMNTPTILEARRIWKDAHITMVGNRHNCELLAACPAIDAFYQTPVVPFTLRGRGKEKILRNWLREQNFDVAVSLLGGEYGPLLAEAQIPVRVCGIGQPLRACYTHYFDDADNRTNGASDQLNSLKCLGYAVNLVPSQLWVLDSARDAARRKLRDLGVKETDEYAVVHPFGSTPRQRWEIDRTAELARELRLRHNLRTVLIGGNETVAAASKIVSENVVNTTGQLALSELLAVIDESKLAISTDSGPFHIAGALEKPLVGMFRSSRPEHAGQYETAKTVFGKYESCDGNCRWDFCQSNPCEQMRRITVEDVLGLVDEQLKRNDSRRSEKAAARND